MKKISVSLMLLMHMYLSCGTQDTSLITVEQHKEYKKMCESLANQRSIPLFEAKKIPGSDKGRWCISAIDTSKQTSAFPIDQKDQIEIKTKDSVLITMALDGSESALINPLIFLFLQHACKLSQQSFIHSESLFFFDTTFDPHGSSTRGYSVNTKVLSESLLSFLNDDNGEQILNERVEKLKMTTLFNAVKKVGFNYQEFMTEYSDQIEPEKNNYAKIIGRFCCALLLILGIFYWTHLLELFKK